MLNEFIMYVTSTGWTDWILPTTEQQLACCDCEMLSDAQIRVLVSKNARPLKNIHVLYRCRHTHIKPIHLFGKEKNWSPWVSAGLYDPHEIVRAKKTKKRLRITNSRFTLEQCSHCGIRHRFEFKLIRILRRRPHNFVEYEELTTEESKLYTVQWRSRRAKRQPREFKLRQEWNE
jgi:hypothetical protein